MLLGKKRHITSAVGGDDRRRFGSLHPLGNVDGRAIDANKGGHGDGEGQAYNNGEHGPVLCICQHGCVYSPSRKMNARYTVRFCTLNAHLLSDQDTRYTNATSSLKK